MRILTENGVVGWKPLQVMFAEGRPVCLPKKSRHRSERVGVKLERHGSARYSDVPIPETMWEQESV